MLGDELLPKQTQDKYQRLVMIYGIYRIKYSVRNSVLGLASLIENLILILQRDPLKHGLRALPLFYGLTLTINIFSVFFDSAESKLFFVYG